MGSHLRAHTRHSRICITYAAIAVLLAVLLILPTGAIEAGAALSTKPQSRKAIYIIPGICGSDLYAEAELSAEELLKQMPEFADSVESSMIAAPGDSLWLPHSLHPLSALAMLSCDKAGRSNMSITTFSEPVTYGPLGVYQYLVLRLGDQLGEEYDIRFFPYDWRMSNYTSALRLQESILYSGYDEVILVTHSMGGLVASSYLAMSQANRDKVRQAVFIAVPFLGTPKTLYAAERGNFFNMTLLRGITSPQTKMAASNFRSIPEILPSRYAFDLPGAAYVTVDGVLLEDYDTTMAYLRTLDNPGINFSFLSRTEAFHRSLFLAGGVHASTAVESLILCGIDRQLAYRVGYDTDGQLTGALFGGSGDMTIPAWSASLGDSVGRGGDYGVQSGRVYYKNLSHFGFILDADTASLVVDYIQEGSLPNAADFGFANKTEIPDEDTISLLDKLEIKVKNGLLALYLKSVADKLAVLLFG